LRQRKDAAAERTYNEANSPMTPSLLTSEDAVRAALREVIDPELGENLVDLGLIYGVTVEETSIVVDLTLTTPGCPLHASLHAAAERAIRLMVPGVERVLINLVWEPRWTPERMSDAAKQRLGFD
jgi:metal-sulfur cluster biosynthetic enzyme